MNQELTFGEMNGHVVGRVMKEAVRRAMVVIQHERFAFEAHAKAGYSGNMDDVLTSADTKAQEIYLRTFEECFPDFGVIAEENALTIKPKNGCKGYFTIDPLDGTKAFTRRQSHGVGTMISLVYDGEVVAAYIGDINTNEVYGYRPGSDKVYRITQLDNFEELVYEQEGPLSASYALLRDPPDRVYMSASTNLLPLFKNYEVGGGSIGIWAARLWKGEVRALLIPRGFETPWDSTPVYGISKKLGFRSLMPAKVSQFGAEFYEWRAFEPELLTTPGRRDHDVLIIHRSDIPERLESYRLHQPTVLAKPA